MPAVPCSATPGLPRPDLPAAARYHSPSRALTQHALARRACVARSCPAQLRPARANRNSPATASQPSPMLAFAAPTFPRLRYRAFTLPVHDGPRRPAPPPACISLSGRNGPELATPASPVLADLNQPQPGKPSLQLLTTSCRLPANTQRNKSRPAWPATPLHAATRRCNSLRALLRLHCESRPLPARSRRNPAFLAGLPAPFLFAP